MNSEALNQNEQKSDQLVRSAVATSLTIGSTHVPTI